MSVLVGRTEVLAIFFYNIVFYNGFTIIIKSRTDNKIKNIIFFDYLYILMMLLPNLSSIEVKTK